MLHLLLSVALAAPATELPAVPPALQVSATEGRSTIAPAPPPYCGVGFTPLSTSYADLDDLSENLRLEQYVEDGKLKSVLQTIEVGGKEAATMACSFPNDANGQAWMVAYKQAFHNQTGAPGELFDRLLGFALEHERAFGTMNYEGPQSFKEPAYANERQVNLHRSMARFASSSGGVRSNDTAWWLDQRAEVPSEAHRALLIQSILNGVVDDSSEGLGHFLFARHDINAFEPSKVRAPLQEAGLTEPWLSVAELRGYIVKQEALEWQREWLARAEQLPELKAVLAAGEQGFVDWTTTFSSHSAGFEAAWTMEEAVLSGRKTSFEGCSDTLAGHYTSYVESAKPVDQASYERMVTAPFPTLLLGAWAVCEKNLGHEGQAALRGHLAALSPVQRGPRTAAVVSALPMVVKGKEDFERFPYETESMLPFSSHGRDLFSRPDAAPLFTTLGSGASPRGVVQSVTAGEDGVRIVFKPEMGKVPTMSCVKTNRIQRIHSNGTVEYQRDCTVTGSETVNQASSPFVVDAFFAAGLKPGMFVQGFHPFEDPGFVLEARTSASAAEPRVVYGYTVR